jgi:hypothetical protein
MTSISVKLAPVGATFQFSEKSHRLFKIVYIGSIVVCALFIPAIILENNARPSSPRILLLFLASNFICLILNAFLASHAVKAESGGDSTAKVSYLPAINLGLMFTLLLLIFYNAYLKYGGA